MGGERNDPTALPPGKKPGTHCIGAWVGPRAPSEMAAVRNGELLHRYLKIRNWLSA